MANTGKKIVLTLKEVETPYPPGTPTGNTKPNIVGDPDYIEPYISPDCSVTGNTDCPELIATGGNDIIEFEFSIPTSVSSNPIISSIKIRVMDSGGVSEIYGVTFAFPMVPATNYKSGSFTSVTPATYQIAAQYLNSSDVPIANCPNITTVTVF